MKEATQDEIKWLAQEIVDGECPIIGDINDDEATLYKLWPGAGYATWQYLVMGDDDFYGTESDLATWLVENAKKGTVWFDMYELREEYGKEAEQEGYEPGSDEYWEYVDETYGNQFITLGDDVAIYTENLKFHGLHREDMDMLRAKLKDLGYKESKKTSRNAIKESKFKAAVARLIREAEENTEDKKDDIRSSHEYSVEVHIHVGDGREVGGGVTESNVELFLDNRYNRSIGYIRTEKNGDSWYIPQDQHGKHDEGVKLEYGLKEAGYEILKAYLEA